MLPWPSRLLLLALLLGTLLSAALFSHAAPMQPDLVIAPAGRYIWGVDIKTGKKKWSYLAGGNAELSRLSLDGSRLYLTQFLWVTALNITHGTEIWSVEMDSPMATAPGVMADDSIVFGTWDDHLYRFHANGTQLWRIGPFPNPVIEMGGYSQPAVDENNTVFHITQGYDLVAVEGATGHVRWRRHLEYQILCSPTLGPNNTVLVVAGGMILHSLYRTNGSDVWTAQIAGRYYEDMFTPTPAIRRTDGAIIVFDGPLHNMNGITALTSDGKPLWYTPMPLAAFVPCTLTVTDDSIFGTGAFTFYALSAEGKLRWQVNTTGMDSADSASLIPTPDGQLIAADAYSVVSLDPSTGALQWNFSTAPIAYGFRTPVLCPCPPPSDAARCTTSCIY